MADDNEEKEKEKEEKPITSEAAQGALAGSITGGLFSAAAPGVTPSEMKTWREWADKAPQLIRKAMGEGPFGKMDDMPQFKSPLSTPLIALGAVAAAATFTRFVPGKWKWVSGAGAVAGIGGGVYLGKKAGEMTNAFSESAQAAKKMSLDYVAALENNPQLRAQLADYLAATMNDAAIRQQQGSFEYAVISKAIEFGQKTPYLQMPEEKDCKTCRFTR